MTWDERYRAGHGSDEQPAPLVERFVTGRQAGDALDLACGVGRHALLLARNGWRVTAVDRSPVAVEQLRARDVSIDARVADLERGEFVIRPDTYDLIVDTLYLQRDLFPSIRNGLHEGGYFVAVLPMCDDDPQVRPMNSAYLIEPGELQAVFGGWAIECAREVKSPGRRRMLEFLARKEPGPGSCGPPDGESRVTARAPESSPECR